MNIWIITTGEQIPEIDGKDVRLWRSVMLTQKLIEKGHRVLRWSASFDHSTKQHRFKEDTFLEINSSYSIQFIKSAGYSKNISFKRILDHKEVASKFKKIANKSPKPDIILCSLPTIELCKEATDYGKKNSIPVVLDGRDMWPDLFEDALPSLLKPLAKLALFPLYRDVRNSCKNATYLTGISSPYINWELRYANRDKKEFDKWFPHGYSPSKPSVEDIEKGVDYWRSFDFINKDDFIVCLFTAMGNVLDMDTLIKAAQKLESKSLPIKFVLCGDGNKLSKFKEKANSVSNILFPGWINSSQIWTLMKLSKVGILPYKNIDNYKLNIPNKPIEYMSAGLPILSSVEGLIKQTIVENNCGKVYNNADELVNILEDLLSNKNKLTQLSVNSKDLFNRQFNAEDVYENMADYLINIATESQNAK